MGRAQVCIVDDNAVRLARLGRLVEDAGLGDVASYRPPLDALTSLRDRHPDGLLVHSAASADARCRAAARPQASIKAQCDGQDAFAPLMARPN